jgi:DNA-binding CsgD family transcriptional regulator
MVGSVIGREAELASLGEFGASIADGAAALVLEGEAGVGKTTLWTAGLAGASERGVRVLEARPAESEIALSFSGIGDLLDSVLDEALVSLPAPQRRALSRALLLDDEGPPPDPHAIGVAVLNAFRALAAPRPLLVAVDDVQWLDPASAGVLGYAARRLRAERVGVMLARRIPWEAGLITEVRRSFPATRVATVEVAPFDPGALHHVVQHHLGIVLPRPLLVDVHQASGGNPFYALEIVRALERTGASVEAGQPLPVPESLHDLVHGRLLALPSESRDFLLAAAALAHPTVAVVEAGSGVGRGQGMRPALEAGIVRLEGERIRFTHPLLAAGAYETVDAERRRGVHARLAELLEDPEARAWQLAAAVLEPSEEVALALEQAAQHARARGAPRAAALLLDRASELTPVEARDDRLRRLVDAAYRHYESGDSPRAEAQLRAVLANLDAGPSRARALVRLARVRGYEAVEEAVALFLQAAEEAGGDRETLAAAHEGAAFCLWRLYERLDEAVEHADLAARLALELGNEALAGEALGTRLIVELLLGRESAAATAALALSLQPAAEELRVLAQPRSAIAMDYLAWVNQPEQARAELLDLLQRAGELGDESSPPFILGHLSMVEAELGGLATALSRALEGQEAAAQAGQRATFAFNVALESLIEAQLGREERARAAARRALDLVPETSGRQAELHATHALGHLELALGDPAAAVRWTEPLLAFVNSEGIVEPCMVRFVADHVEALIELGRREEALDLLDWYEGNARRLVRVTAVAACLRCRGLVAASSGQLDTALAAYGEALEWHARLDLPLDRGRTLLALGAAQRRTKRRREARHTLEDALALFERIGAALWANRTRAELGRISGRAPTAGALTPAEERVAALVAEGKTNREVAAALFLSNRTVEGHLSRVFAKLGIGHRSEVARALAARQTQGTAASNTGDASVSADAVAP